MNANTKTRIARCSSPRVLARAASLFLTWGDRAAADAAHIQRGKVHQAAARMRRHIAAQRAAEANETDAERAWRSNLTALP